MRSDLDQVEQCALGLTNVDTIDVDANGRIPSECRIGCYATANCQLSCRTVAGGWADLQIGSESLHGLHVGYTTT